MSSGDENQAVLATLFSQWASIGKLVIDGKRDPAEISYILQYIIARIPLKTPRERIIAAIEDQSLWSTSPNHVRAGMLETELLLVFGGNPHACMRCYEIEKSTIVGNAELVTRLLYGKVDLGSVLGCLPRHMKLDPHDQGLKLVEGVLEIPSIEFGNACITVDELMRAIKETLGIPIPLS